MSIKIVVVDAGLLPPGVEFPPLKIPKYGWEEYLGLDAEGMAERCWRADVIDHYVASGATNRTDI